MNTLNCKYETLIELIDRGEKHRIECFYFQNNPHNSVRFVIVDSNKRNTKNRLLKIFEQLNKFEGENINIQTKKTTHYKKERGKYVK